MIHILLSVKRYNGFTEVYKSTADSAYLIYQWMSAWYISYFQSKGTMDSQRFIRTQQTVLISSISGCLHDTYLTFSQKYNGFTEVYKSTADSAYLIYQWMSAWYISYFQSKGTMDSQRFIRAQQTVLISSISGCLHDTYLTFSQKVRWIHRGL